MVIGGITRSVESGRPLPPERLAEAPPPPEAAAEAMRAYAEETNRINRERRVSGASDRKELADVEKKIASIIAVIEDGGCVRGMVDRLRELEARQDELNERLSAAPADLPDVHPNIADIYRRKVARLAEALDHPEVRWRGEGSRLPRPRRQPPARFSTARFGQSRYDGTSNQRRRTGAA